MEIIRFKFTRFLANHALRISKRLNHLRRIDPAVKFLLGEVAELEGGGFEGKAFAVSGFGDGRGFVVTDMRVEGGHQHQRIVEVFGQAFGVGTDALRAVGAERMTSIGDEASRL